MRGGNGDDPTTRTIALHDCTKAVATPSLICSPRDTAEGYDKHKLYLIGGARVLLFTSFWVGWGFPTVTLGLLIKLP